MDTRRKLNGILNTIHDTARAEADALDAETRGRRDAAVTAYADELLVEAYSHIRRETSRLRTAAGTRISTRQSDNKRTLYRLRTEAADTIVQRVQKRLCGFAASDAYPAALSRIAVRAARELAGDDLVVLLRDCDMPLAETLGIRAEFRASPDIKIGGLVAQSITRRLRIDLTYDKALEKARSEFRTVSGSGL